MGGMMWGVRRRDAARHNESGWLIRPETRPSSLPRYFPSHSLVSFYLQPSSLSVKHPTGWKKYRSYLSSC